MRRSTIAIIAIMIAVLTILIALIASENAQYTAPITVRNGVAYVDTAHGETTMDAINENDQTVPQYKADPIMPITPSVLPPTSAPHGTQTCTITDNNGNTFSVTRNDCSTL